MGRDGTWSSHKRTGGEQGFRHAAPAVPVRLKTIGVGEVAGNERDGSVGVQHVLAGLDRVVCLTPVTDYCNRGAGVWANFWRRQKRADTVNGLTYSKAV